MTTDTFPKTSRIQGQIDGRTVTLAGIAKGSGMIHPDMATMLVFLFTDAVVAPKALKAALKKNLASSFNRITVDGDTSTNDCILLLAGGTAGNPAVVELQSSSRRDLQLPPSDGHGRSGGPGGSGRRKARPMSSR